MVFAVFLFRLLQCVFSSLNEISSAILVVRMTVCGGAGEYSWFSLFFLCFSFRLDIANLNTIQHELLVVVVAVGVGMDVGVVIREGVVVGVEVCAGGFSRLSLLFLFYYRKVFNLRA